MDPFSNLLAPGAGTAPPELAGRDALRETARIAMERIRRGNPAKSLVLVGLRGAGKTVLLDRLRLDAEAAGLMTLQVEAPERHSLPAILAPQLRLALLRLSRIERAKELALRGLRGLAGFARALKVKYHDIEVGLDAEPEPGLADNGNLEQDLQALMELAGGAAREAETALVLCIDELQYVPGAVGSPGHLPAPGGPAPPARADAGRRVAAVARPDWAGKILRRTALRLP